MITDLDENNIENDQIVKPKIPLEEANFLLQKEAEYFITLLKLHFFKRFNISTHFIDFNPDVWNKDIDFLKGQNIVKHHKVVNDSTERDIKLIVDYYESTTKDEGQKQYILLVVVECRKLFWDTLKFISQSHFNFFDTNSSESVWQCYITTYCIIAKSLIWNLF